MKVLLSAAWNPAFEAVPEYLVAALGRAGHQVACFDHRSYRLPGRIRDRIPRLHRLDRLALNRRLRRLARSFRPDLLLVLQGSPVEPQTAAAIRSDTGARTVNWWLDYPAEFSDGLAASLSGAYDRFFVTGTDALARHHGAGAGRTAWLPFGCDPDLHRPVEPGGPGNGDPGCKVAFVGSAYPERRDLLAGLADLDLGIWGPGWERYRDDPALRGAIRGGAQRPAEWIRIYSAADVVLNISYGLGGDAESYGTMANVRVFEALACGACQVVDAKKDILNLFRDGVHLATFRDGEEMRQRVLTLLEDREKRARLAGRGRKEVLSRHTWSRRLETILEPVVGGVQ